MLRSRAARCASCIQAIVSEDIAATGWIFAGLIVADQGRCRPLPRNQRPHTARSGPPDITPSQPPSNGGPNKMNVSACRIRATRNR